MGGHRAPPWLDPTARVGVRNMPSAAWVRRGGTWVNTTRVSDVQTWHHGRDRAALWERIRI